MAQTRKVEGQAEIKCNADKLFEVWGLNTPLVSKMCPNINKVELLEGDNCHTVGSILSWTYVNPVDEKHDYVKTLLEDIDEKEKTFSYKLIAGEIMCKHYKTWRQKVEVIPKGENCSIVKMSIIEYEKKSEDAPDPIVYVDFLLDSFKHTDRHLCSA